MTASPVTDSKAQTKDIHQSQTTALDQSYHFQVNNASRQSSNHSSPITSPQPTHFSNSNHHLHILGNHPASPVFLDMQSESFMPRSNLLFSDYESEYPANDLNSSPLDTQASGDFLYSHHNTHRATKSEFSNEHFAAMAPSYMMAMSRSFSESQLSMCDDASPSFLSSQAGLNQATGARDMDMCESPLVYGSQNVYEDEYYMSHHNHHNHHNHHHSHHPHSHHHSHSYSTSSLSTLSEDSSSMSPRSPFSNSMSLSNSSNSIASAYPLSRNLSESLIPIFQAECMAPSSDASKPDGVKSTPKRSRGRRVSSHPDNSGCKVFTCRYEDCGKIFKRSEHLKRHVRSIHTMDKPFECPIQNCPKRFSRSDNLNQHIRIHRHSPRGKKDLNGLSLHHHEHDPIHSKAFASFTPFLQSYSTDMISLN
ncbi:hypothetical protein CPB97_006788 [Podila verticillata]|nr:hypothetical protein CPB97_006788 [Podila verticillata]